MRRLERTGFLPPITMRDVRGIRVSMSAYAGSSAFPWHEHQHAYLCLVADGAYCQRARGSEEECRRGLLLIHPQGHRHANRFDPQGARTLDVFLSPSWQDQAGVRRLLSDYRRLRLPGVQAVLARLIRELAATDDAAELALESTVLDLLAQAIRRGDAGTLPSWMPRVVERLHDDPRRTPSLMELAVLAGVHPAHLARTFRRVHGVTVGEHQRKLRVTKACRSLLEPSRAIAQIAAEAGFADQSHFSRVFRRLIGQTPSEYRRTMLSRS